MLFCAYARAHERKGSESESDWIAIGSSTEIPRAARVCAPLRAYNCLALEDGRLIVGDGATTADWMLPEIHALRTSLEEAERKADLQDAKWYQIHTNGATTTFARYYASPDGTGEFEKMQVDVVNGTAEVFGEEHYFDWQDAKTRVRVAIKEGM